MSKPCSNSSRLIWIWNMTQSMWCPRLRDISQPVDGVLVLGGSESLNTQKHGLPRHWRKKRADLASGPCPPICCLGIMVSIGGGSQTRLCPLYLLEAPLICVLQWPGLSSFKRGHREPTGIKTWYLKFPGSSHSAADPWAK